MTSFTIVDAENGCCKCNQVVVPPILSSNRPRLVAKDGSTLFTNIGIPGRRKLVRKNWFQLTLECQWRFILLAYIIIIFFSWITFGFLYYIITIHIERKNCVENVDSFLTALLYSIETETTLGYGNKFITHECPIALTIFPIQILSSQFVHIILSGIVVAKFLRSKKRSREMRFSRLAVIGPVDEHDKRPCLMIRLADVQEKLFLAESHVKLYIVTSRINEVVLSKIHLFVLKRGQKELRGIRDINVGYDKGYDRALLLWPIVVRHIIDQNSPFHGLTKEQFQSLEFELVMTAEGNVEATGMNFQARTSFLPSEILWGYRFKPMIILNEQKCKYEVHYAYFDEMERVSEFGNDLAVAEETVEKDPHNISTSCSNFVTLPSNRKVNSSNSCTGYIRITGTNSVFLYGDIIIEMCSFKIMEEEINGYSNSMAQRKPRLVGKDGTTLIEKRCLSDKTISVSYSCELLTVPGIIFFIQVIIEKLLQMVLVGVIITKIVKSDRKKQEVRFSQLAVIGPVNEYDKRRCLTIRLAGTQEILLLDSSQIKVKLVMKGYRELQSIRLIKTQCKIDDRTQLVRILLVRHIIDKNSPFYGLTRKQLDMLDFEIIITLKGIVEKTGKKFLSRTSFLPDEILWEHRFKSMISLSENNGKFRVQPELFEQTERVSACEYDLEAAEN